MKKVHIPCLTGGDTNFSLTEDQFKFENLACMYKMAFVSMRCVMM